MRKKPSASGAVGRVVARARSRVRTGSRSRGRLREATTALLDERDAADITVTDIVAAAGVSRPTFYAAYPDLGQAFADAALARLAEVFAGVDPDGDLLDGDPLDPESLGDIDPQVQVALGRLEPHIGFFVRVLRGPSGMTVIRGSVEYVAERILQGPVLGPALARGPMEPVAAARALAAAVVWTAVDWAVDEERRLLDELVSDIALLLRRSIAGGLGGA
ncbi:TetR/AcrR family transcriptional regulator [Corynebacterium sp.]|uniref:TetR/AcrR family transcriptional regulator n=1 Tax=Corynebacterium sp. TaxID=1720 RepID=UPI0026DC6F91|nr:TetR/AcrR family transcriptional regulator [Corynebacterium sp.]MDO4609854.1 TetR/AcrR family transcriptional regulator [Corynebacterium sp.]